MNKLSKIKKIALLCAAIVVGASCTNRDPLFGNGMVPPSQELNTLIDSSLTVKTSLFEIDSVPTSLSPTSVFLGSTWNELVGRTTCEIWTTYLPQVITLKDQQQLLFGKDPVLDSMFILFNFNQAKGDTSYKLHISVHEIKDTIIKYYKTYYSNFDGDNYYDPTPLVEFDLSGGAQSLKKKLPASYFNKLLINPIYPQKDNPYFSDSMFIERFKGLCFMVKEVEVPRQGTMYRMDLGLTTLQLHYHNKETKPDTTYIGYQCYMEKRRSTGFYTVDNEFELADPDQGGVVLSDIGDSTVSNPITYAMGLAGLGTRVEIDTVHLNKLKQKAIDMGYKSIALHRASIRWYIVDPESSTYVFSPSRLCLYYNFNDRKPVPDYDPVRESVQYSNFVSDIGGKVNRSNGYYEQTITSTVQRLINKSANASNVVQLLPSTPEMQNYGYIALGGSTSGTYPPQLVLVYSMVK